MCLTGLRTLPHSLFELQPRSAVLVSDSCVHASITQVTQKDDAPSGGAVEVALSVDSSRQLWKKECRFLCESAKGWGPFNGGGAGVGLAEPCSDIGAWVSGAVITWLDRVVADARSVHSVLRAGGVPGQLALLLQGAVPAGGAAAAAVPASGGVGVVPGVGGGGAGPSTPGPAVHGVAAPATHGAPTPPAAISGSGGGGGAGGGGGGGGAGGAAAHPSTAGALDGLLARAQGSYASGTGHPLQPDQLAAIRASWGQQGAQLQLLQGPPGTGKTETCALLVLVRAAALALAAARAGSADAAPRAPPLVLLSANTNTAVAGLLERVALRLGVLFGAGEEEACACVSVRACVCARARVWVCVMGGCDTLCLINLR